MTYEEVEKLLKGQRRLRMQEKCAIRDEAKQRAEEILRKIESAMEYLSYGQREVLDAMYWRGMSWKETVYVLGASGTTINRWRKEGIQNLCDALNGQCTDGYAM